jgi:hypothetical protein
LRLPRQISSLHAPAGFTPRASQCGIGGASGSTESSPNPAPSIHPCSSSPENTQPFSVVSAIFSPNRAALHLRLANTTDTRGFYAFPQIPVGVYEVTFGDVIQGTEAAAVPLNGRSFTDLLSLQAGVTPVQSFTPGPLTAAAASVISPAGTAPRYFFGPGVDTFDMAVQETIRVTESSQFQIRLESFNTFNHAHFFGLYPPRATSTVTPSVASPPPTHPGSSRSPAGSSSKSRQAPPTRAGGQAVRLRVCPRHPGHRSRSSIPTLWSTPSGNPGSRIRANLC